MKTKESKKTGSETKKTTKRKINNINDDVILSKVNNNHFFEKIKPMFNKKNIIITIVIIVIILIAILLLTNFNKKDNRFALNEIYDVYPEEVRKLYSNIVEISCKGDLHLDNIKVDSETTPIDNIAKNNLLDYLFSNIDKNEGLSDKIEVDFIRNKQKDLFNSKLDLTEAINNYQYGDYVYTVKNNKLTRVKNECKSDMQYVTFLYGYAWNKNLLSMDVNVSYLKDGILYDLADNRLGQYDGDISRLSELTQTTSFYRFNYSKDGNDFKLDSIRWMNRS